jgi:hypothetical protein
MSNQKSFFIDTPGFAIALGPRVYITEPLARSIGWPWAKPTVNPAVAPDPVVEVFDFNGRPIGGLSRFANEFELQAKDVPSLDLPFSQVVAHEVVDPALLFETAASRPSTVTFRFTTVEALRRTWRQSLTRPDGPFSLTLSGVVSSGKWKPNGRAKAWFTEPIEVDNLKILSVKTNWIFLESDLFVSALEPGAIVTVEHSV